MHLLLLTMLSESTNLKEEEVSKLLCECLDLRKAYVYREEVAPWKAKPLAKNPDPYHFEPVEATSVCLLIVQYGSHMDLCFIFASICKICMSNFKSI